jgi:hypothetical protein
MLCSSVISCRLPARELLPVHTGSPTIAVILAWLSSTST